MAAAAPDGIFYRTWTDTTGRHIDRRFYSDSQMNEIMRLALVLAMIQWKIYTDKGFTTHTHTTAAYHGANVTAEQHDVNRVMSTLRITEEWDFGKLKKRCPLLNRKNVMHIQKSPVLRMIRVAVLLTNAHTCMRGSQTGEYFNCSPPVFEDYFILPI